MAFCGDSAATSARLTASTQSERPETALCHVPVANRRPTTSSPAAQAVHQAAKAQLQLPRPGESTHAFMRDVLAPLVTIDTPEYLSLKRDIFDQ